MIIPSTVSTGTSVGRLAASGITNNSTTTGISTLNSSSTTSVTVPGQLPETRVRISLPPTSTLLYKDGTNALLSILQTTNGVIFPFQPNVSIGFNANYSNQDLTHSNFAYNFYQNSRMDNIDISGEFVVRNPWEGSYVIAAMHFLRSSTMMFTGIDGTLAGVPPPVLRLNGMGFGGLDNIPVVLASVNVTYPENVDYVTVAVPSNNSATTGSEVTKIPVSLTISVSCIPMFSRDFASNFGVTNYANGTTRLLGAAFDNSTQSGDQLLTDNASGTTNPTSTSLIGTVS